MTARLQESVCLLFFVLVISACKDKSAYTPENLSKISQEDMLTRFKNRDLPNQEDVVFKSPDGMEITLDSLMKIKNPQDFAQDFYQTENGQIQEVILRPATEVDKAFASLLEKTFEEGPDVHLVEVNCDDKVRLLQEIFDRDQAMRQPGAQYDPKVEHENLEIIISFLEKCGMPTLEEVNEIQMAAIWAVLQHGPARYQSKYLPMIEEAAENGDIKRSVVALMKDRALMHEGKPQIYGSQLRNGTLYDLYEPEYVNQRRAEMGMEPLEEYLKRFGVEFDVAQKRKLR